MSIGTSALAPGLDAAAPGLPAGALSGLAVLVPLSALWLGALLHCGYEALRALRAPVDHNHNESEQEAPLTWLLLLILGSFVAALVYAARELLMQRTGRRAGAVT
ncbi:MAG: hypothetical protein U1A78_18420 [Polyangia bacterium]